MQSVLVVFIVPVAFVAVAAVVAHHTCLRIHLLTHFGAYFDLLLAVKQMTMSFYFCISYAPRVALFCPGQPCMS